MIVRVPLFPTAVRWAAVAGVAGFIFHFSLLAPPPETIVDSVYPWFVPLDKWRHFVAYLTLAATLAYATADWDVPRWRAYALVVTVTALYGVGIEVGQALTPGRHFDPGDIVANALGAALVGGWYLVRPRLEFVPVPRWLPNRG